MIKNIHMACALLSIAGFFARGLLMIKESGLLQARWIRIAPHVVDTLLLASAVILASQWGWAALQQPWLLAKIVALLVYIGLGTLALRGGRTKSMRIVAWLMSLLVFAYIVAVAISKSVIPY